MITTDIKTNLEKFTTSIQRNNVTRLNYEYPKLNGGWNEFLEKTDIGNLMSKNNYYLFNSLNNNKQIKGAFIKINDELYGQIILLNSEKSNKTGICIDIFHRNQLITRVSSLYNELTKNTDIKQHVDAITNLNPFEIELTKTNKL